MTTADNITKAASATTEAAEFQQAFAEYKRQRDALEQLDKMDGKVRHDFSEGNPFDALDNAFAKMMRTPAPTLDALIRKMEATTGDMAENCGWETQYYVQQLIADARRLNGVA